MTDKDWNRLASNFLKAELKRQGVNYLDLQKKLEEIGINETSNSINIKINRGTFSFVFFMQVMKVLNNKIVRLEND